MKRWSALAVILTFLGGLSIGAAEPKAADKANDAAPAKAGEPVTEDPAHAELRALREGLVAAIKKNDVDAVLSYLDPDVVVTWQNGEVSRKPDGVRAYYDRVMKGPNRVVDSYATNPTADDLTHLYGNMGVAFGSSLDHYKLTDGTEFDLPTRWSAAVVKTDGKWRIANFHASVNMFDNPVLVMTVKRVGLWVSLIAGGVGLLLGFMVARMVRGRSASGPQPKTVP